MFVLNRSYTTPSAASFLVTEEREEALAQSAIEVKTCGFTRRY